ncbi:O-methylsterigmatocystin oxidoreductase [Mycena sanguinolenta]|uniref:O-methylsterigmatocystin oxidoreductase n=1 Tax=Mycena sanguinolenta TaxID=230812 RepID=A0A8H6XXM0_9AGAR|nr:O-methylsterigmatocystin oxidoreductase [Mycena sanguinolenta]
MPILVSTYRMVPPRGRQYSMAYADHLLPVAVSAILFAVVGLLQRWKGTARLPFPPGPKPRFLVGNLFDIPTETPWITYTEWGKQYGDVVHAQVFGQHILILNSIKAATELLEKRAIIYSDRSRIPIVSLMGWDFSFVLIPYSDKWRERRRLFHQHFRRDAIPGYHPVYFRKIRDLLRDLLSTPEQFATHTKTMTAAIILDTVYGCDIRSMRGDQFVRLTEEASVRVTESMLPGACIVNTLPFLRHFPSWFPGCGFHKLARDTRDLVNEMKNAPFDFVKQNMRNDAARPSVVRELLERNDTHHSSREQEEVIKDVAGIAYAAAVDTTTATLIVFIMVMALNPEVAKKAQNELDAVVGLGFLPGFEHRSALPYCEAVVREVFRWRPILPFAIPHATTDDDIYEGYFIPKGWFYLTAQSARILHKLGTTVLPNVWAMARDESMYPNPDKFDPERFLNADGQLNGDDQILGFGFGRRACVGRHAADATVWATIVSVLSTFDIAKAKNEAGKEIEIKPEFTDGTTSHPKPFKCSITPRNHVIKQLITNMTDV